MVLNVSMSACVELACRHRRVVGATQVVANADVTRRDVRNHHRNEEWRKPRDAIPSVKILGFIHERRNPADARSPNHPRPIGVEISFSTESPASLRAISAVTTTCA